MRSKLFSEILKSDRENTHSLYIGLNVHGGDIEELKIEGGEDPRDYHVTLLYGYFSSGSDFDALSVMVQSAIRAIQSDIPESLVFFHEHRFEASESSDNKDVIVARVTGGVLETIHERLIKELKKNGLRIKKTFPQYIPHMTLAYIEPGTEYELRVLDHSAAVKDISVKIKHLDSKANEAFRMVTKFNPYHDRLGRFSSAGGASSFTYSPGKSKAHDMAIAREKERTASTMPTAAQATTLKGIENRTRNLKKEQLRVVDRDGNVVMTKQGNKHSVSYTMGEARDNFPGNITIHNHPDGGTFSTSDLSDIGHGATEIRAAAPEGTYILRNTRHGSKWVDGQKSWIDMRDDLDAASLEFKSGFALKKEVRESFTEDRQKISDIADRWNKARSSGASQEELNKYYTEYDAAEKALRSKVEVATRKAYTDQYHNWYKVNSMKYGLEYEFNPVKTRTKKSLYEEEFVQKSDGDIVLDRDFNNDIEELTNTIMNELIGDIQKSFNHSHVSSFNITKADEDQRLVFGWALVSADIEGNMLIDHQGDMVDQDELEQGAYEYVLNFRDAGEEHMPGLRKKARMVESVVLTEEKMKAMGIPLGTVPYGWWIGFYVDDDETWEKIKNGTYRMFSIEGRAIREPVNNPVTKALRNFDEFPEISMWYEENMDATEEDIKAAKEYYSKKSKVAKSFSELIEKFNPYHDRLGRFSSAGGATSFTYRPRCK